MLALVAQHLTIGRGGRVIGEHLDFRVEAGSGLLLTGPNGAGKTTLLRTIAGFLRPLAGVVRIDGLGADSEPGEAIHAVGHHNGLRAALTVRENLAFWGRFFADGGDTGVRPGGSDPMDGADDLDNRVDNALDAFNLFDLEDIPAGALSAGQKRRLGLARLLVSPRPIWLLDEPNVSLDVASRALFAGVVDARIAGGGIVLAATHLPLGSKVSRELHLGQSQPAAVAATAGAH